MVLEDPWQAVGDVGSQRAGYAMASLQHLRSRGTSRSAAKRYPGRRKVDRSPSFSVTTRSLPLVTRS
jgi:hypothetical protein